MLSEMKKHLSIAYNTLSSMPQVGDNVDLMARAKEHLRIIDQLIKKEESKVGKQENTGSSED